MNWDPKPRNVSSHLCFLHIHWSSELILNLLCPGLCIIDKEQFSLQYIIYYFPGGSDGKESTCNAGDPDWIPGSGRSPEEGNGYPLQYSCLESFMNRSYSLWGHKESHMPKQLTLLHWVIELMVKNNNNKGMSKIKWKLNEINKYFKLNKNKLN